MLTVPAIRKMKNSRKIVMLTAYDYLYAKYLETAGVDIILVGDSLGMVFNGRPDTLAVTLDEVVYHTKAVRRGAPDTAVIADMPFMSYQPSVRDAKLNAGRIIRETGALAVKVEGGLDIINQVSALVDAGVPVMGHIGMQPQSVKNYGGYPVTGKTPAERDALTAAAIALEKAGAFAIVAEKVEAKTAKEITASVNIPVIGIGAGPWCDGQVLVTHDMTGAFTDFTPKFVKKYADTGARSTAAVRKFCADVKNGRFPGKKNYWTGDK